MTPQEKQFLVSAYELIRELTREVDDLHDRTEALQKFETEKLFHATGRYDEILKDQRIRQLQNQRRRDRLELIGQAIDKLRSL